MKKTLIVLATLLACSALHADVIANWDNDPLEASSTTAPVGSTAAWASSSDLTMGSGLNSSAGYPDALTGIQNNSGINSLATAISGNHYFSFTITPDGSTSVNYDSLFVRLSLQANAQPATTEFSLLSDLTGFTSSDAIDSFTASATVSGLNHATDTFDLSGSSALQGVSAGTPIEFRIYAHNTAANSMTRLGIGNAFATDAAPDLTLNGTVAAIPEPASLSLFGLAGLALLWMRRTFR